jgi:hypothetical protein
VPGLKVLEHAVDGAGRPGDRHHLAGSQEIAGFRPNRPCWYSTSFAYLGVADGGAVLTSAIVDKVNQRP